MEHAKPGLFRHLAISPNPILTNFKLGINFFIQNFNCQLFLKIKVFEMKQILALLIM